VAVTGRLLWNEIIEINVIKILIRIHCH